MSALADLEKAKHNAAKVLGRSERRWQIFEKVNGKLSGLEIANQLGIKQTNVVNDLTFLENQGLIRNSKKSTRSVVYEKIPELRNINLHSYLRNNYRSSSADKSEESEKTDNEKVETIIYSQIINRVIETGQKHGIENIDQNWIDALTILNFIETSTTKFLMEHGYTEDQVKDMKWEEKLNKLEAKLFEEARLKNVTLKTTVVAFFKNYRVLRNDIDHHAHLASARVTKPEVTRLLKDLNDFVKVVFEQHKTYCQINP